MRVFHTNDKMIRVDQGDESLGIAIGSDGGYRSVLHLNRAEDPRGLERTVHPHPQRSTALQVGVTVSESGMDGRHSLKDCWSCLLPSNWDAWWAPHLRPGSDLRIAAHSFRSPCLIVLSDGISIAVIPDLLDAGANRWIDQAILDLDVTSKPAATLSYGLEPTRPTRHVYFETDPDTPIRPEGGMVRYSYEIHGWRSASWADTLRYISEYLWNRFGRATDLWRPPDVAAADRLAEAAYGTLFDSGGFVTFQQTGRRCGAFRAESHHADYFARPDPVVWNQCWFNAQRSAYGLAFFGERHGKPDWSEASRLITQFTLSAPMWGGVFPAILHYPEREWWGSIPRLNGGRTRIHLADVAITAKWLLRFHSDFGCDEALGRCIDVGNAIVRLQQDDGSIPPWHDWADGQLTAAPELARSAETAAPGAFLAQLAAGRNVSEFERAARLSAEFLAEHIVLIQNYQDFETFYSCSPKPLDFRDPYTGLNPQNSLAAYWTALTMLRVHVLTSDEEYLRLAREAVDQLSLYQQIWSPPFLSLQAFGGFGVMNTDAEWSDARQSVFAPLYIEFYEATGDSEYLERGIAAAKASFALACLPEHESCNPKGYLDHPLGIMPENYGHSGTDRPSGRSDTSWGECGALTMAAILKKKYNIDL